MGPTLTKLGPGKANVDQDLPDIGSTVRNRPHLVRTRPKFGPPVERKEDYLEAPIEQRRVGALGSVLEGNSFGAIFLRNISAGGARYRPIPSLERRLLGGFLSDQRSGPPTLSGCPIELWPSSFPRNGVATQNSIFSALRQRALGLEIGPARQTEERGRGLGSVEKGSEIVKHLVGMFRVKLGQNFVVKFTLEICGLLPHFRSSRLGVHVSLRATW